MTATAFPSDLEIARSVRPRPIVDVAADLGIRDEELELYGPNKAKVTLDAIRRLETERPNGKYVVVTAITPTPRTNVSGSRALTSDSSAARSRVAARLPARPNPTP